MAITIQNTFNDVVAVQEPLVLTASSTNTAQAKFRYVLTVDIDGVEVIKIKQQKNQNNWVHFDISKILKDYFEPRFLVGTDPIHNESRCRNNDDGAFYVELNCYEEYAASATTNPTEYPSAGNATTDFIALNTTNQFSDGTTPTLLDVVEYNDNNTALSWLTKMPTNLKTRVGEYATSAILIADFTSGGSFPVTNADVQFNLTYFEADGTQIADYQIPYVTALNGVTFRNSKTTFSADRIVQFIPVGYENLEGLTNSTYRPSSQSTTPAYYEIFIYDDNFSGSGYRTKTYRFDIADCTRYTPIQLAWVNEYGVWDYFTFELAHQKRLQVNRTEIRKDYGNWNSGEVYSYNQHERGQKVVNVNGDVEYTCNSNWLNEDEFTWLQGLLMSKEVQFNNSGTWQAVTITSTDYNYKQDVDSELANLEIKFKTANRIR